MHYLVTFCGGFLLCLAVFFPQLSSTQKDNDSLKYSLDTCNNQVIKLESENRGMIINR